MDATMRKAVPESIIVKSEMVMFVSIFFPRLTQSDNDIRLFNVYQFFQIKVHRQGVRFTGVKVRYGS